MEKDFQDYYQSNLEYLRKLGGEFAREFPKIASRLELSATDCQDPYVERLLEGAAFLAARVEKKFDDGAPRLLESFLASAAPQVLSPLPSFCVQELQELNVSQQAQQHTLPCYTQFSVNVPGVKTPCIFSTLNDVWLYNAKIKDFRYQAQELGNYGLAAEAGIYFELNINETNIPEDAGNLNLYLNLNDADASELQRQLQVDLLQVYVKTDSGYVPCGDISFQIPGLCRADGDNHMIGTKRLNGIRTLQRFLAFQTSYKFIRIDNFRKLIPHISNGRLEFIATLKRRNPNFVHLLNSRSVKLNCVPATNLFFKRSDRCYQDIQHEVQVIPDRTAPLDYEVIMVLASNLFNAGNNCVATFRNLYDEQELFGGKRDREYFSVHRQPRIISQQHQARSSYSGSEVFLSLTGETLRLHQDEPIQMAVNLICSNRDIPLLLHGDMILKPQNDALVKAAKFAALPSRPQPPLIESGGMADWEKVGFLTLHFSSMLWQKDIIPLEMLREMIRQYSPKADEKISTFTSGIIEFSNEPSVFRFIRKGSVFFEQGWKLRLTLDETAYAGTGFYIFAVLIREILAGYAPLNTPLQLELYTTQQGKITEWMM